MPKHAQISRVPVTDTSLAAILPRGVIIQAVIPYLGQAAKNPGLVLPLGGMDIAHFFAFGYYRDAIGWSNTCAIWGGPSDCRVDYFRYSRRCRASTYGAASPTLSG